MTAALTAKLAAAANAYRAVGQTFNAVRRGVDEVSGALSRVEARQGRGHGGGDTCPRDGDADSAVAALARLVAECVHRDAFARRRAEALLSRAKRLAGGVRRGQSARAISALARDLRVRLDHRESLIVRLTERLAQTRNQRMAHIGDRGCLTSAAAAELFLPPSAACADDDDEIEAGATASAVARLAARRADALVARAREAVSTRLCDARDAEARDERLVARADQAAREAREAAAARSNENLSSRNAERGFADDADLARVAAERDAALALAERERARAARAEEAASEVRSTLALKQDEIDRAQAARDAAAAAAARAERAEAESVSLRARADELEAALRAKDAGLEAHEAAMRDAEERVRAAHAAATAAAEGAARDRGAVETARAATRRAEEALAVSERRVAEGAAEARLARVAMEEMVLERKTHARALALLRGERDGAKAGCAEAEAEKLEAVKELEYLRDATAAAARKHAASLEALRAEAAAVAGDLEDSRRANESLREDAIRTRSGVDDVTRDLVEARAETEKWRFEAQSVSRALAILRGQHEAFVIAAGGAPAPATPLLRRRPSGEDGDDGGDERAGAGGERTERSAGIGTEGDLAAPRRASEGASPAASPAAAASDEVGDDSEYGGEGEGGGGGGGDDGALAPNRLESA